MRHVSDYEKKLILKEQATEDGDSIDDTGVEANKENLSLPSNVSNSVVFNKTETHGGHHIDTDETRENLSNMKSCDESTISTKTEDLSRQLLRTTSWCPQSVEPSSISFQRSHSVPNGTIQPNEAKKKKKSGIIKKLTRKFKKKNNNHESVILNESKQSNNQEESGLNAKPSSSVHTASDSYSECPKQETENLSPLVESGGRKSSLTDSLSSVGSVSSPTSPGCDSGYFSSDGRY